MALPAPASWLSLLLAAVPVAAAGQTLPPHAPLRILIVSDEVNPHGLTPAQLTQPGDIAATLALTPALHLAGDAEALLEIPTDQIEQATQRLQREPTAADAYDVVVYFAHRIPNGANAQARQEAFVAALQRFVTAGGGLVSFHHGIYYTAGKESLQQLLAGQASGAVPWNTLDGQNVINVAPGHFISSNGLSYAQTLAYADAAFGVAPGQYGYFNNTPDERYPQLQLLPGSGVRTALFASDYADNGTAHVLGYTWRQPHWAGVAVVYQPGEYQPHALGAGDPNFQILLNALVYPARVAASEIVFRDGYQ